VTYLWQEPQEQQEQPPEDQQPLHGSGWECCLEAIAWFRFRLCFCLTNIVAYQNWNKSRSK
jgi:hypothetical protein